MVSRVATIIFFLVFGLNVFVPFTAALTILGIDAIILAIAITVGAYAPNSGDRERG